ncbi:MAG: NUDIX hydrolase [Gemmatimonadales bacterium]
MAGDGTVGIRRAYSGRYINVDVATVRLPKGADAEFEIIRHPGASAVVPLLSGSERDPGVLLLRQYRFAAGGTIWEIPAGVLEPGETPEDCARRELKEETGATADHFDLLVTIFTTPGFTDEKIHLYVASGITPGACSHQTDENIEVEERPMSQVLEMIQDGTIRDGKSIAALLMAARYRLRI